jgi:hypothetical protein
MFLVVYPQKLALTSPTRDFRSVGIVRSRTQATEFLRCIYFFLFMCQYYDCFELEYVLEVPSHLFGEATATHPGINVVTSVSQSVRGGTLLGYCQYIVTL